MRLFRLSPFLWTALAAAVAFILGYAGYRHTLSPGMGPLDITYQTMQLFVIGSQFGPHVPWMLQIARFLAPISLATAALVAAATFLRDQYERLLIALFARDHVVVVGLSESSGSIAESLSELGQRIIIVEADPTHARLAGLRAMGARVVIGDGRQAVTLRRARIDRARHVVVTTGDDATSLDVADQVRSLRQSGAGRHTAVHVAIDDPELWLEVGRLTFGRSTGGTTIECFNRIDRKAARIVELASSEGVVDRVAVVGSGPLAARVVTHLRRRALLDGNQVSVLDEPDHDVPTVLACSAEGALAQAITIARTYGGTRVVAPVDTDTTDTVIALLGDLSDRLHLVPTTSARLAADLLRSSSIELMARAKHTDYLSQELAKGLNFSDNPSLLPWEELPESLRESNRRFAASVAETLAVVGASLQPLRDEEVRDLALDPDDLEQLAIREHDRWEQDLRADGWTYGPAPKDPLAKTHPLLVPWDDLSEEEREKDRDAIRAIPAMLARVGYSIERAI